MRIRATQIRGARVLAARVVDRLRADVCPGDSSRKEEPGFAGTRPQIRAEQLQGRRVQAIDARPASFQPLNAQRLLAKAHIVYEEPRGFAAPQAVAVDEIEKHAVAQIPLGDLCEEP